MKPRYISNILLEKAKSKIGRIIILTGARQVGKTTLVKKYFPNYRYISLDNPMLRHQYSLLTTQQWFNNYPVAILDEVQKTPNLIDSIKAVYDEFSDTKYILLGSSQFLLLEKVRESLAGRCIIQELFPFILPEMLANDDFSLKDSFFKQFIENKISCEKILPSFSLHDDYAIKQKVFDQYLQYGAYPALSDNELSNTDKREWLHNYTKTFLERDIRDLSNFRDLEPFLLVQKYLSQYSGCIVNYSDIAKETGISLPTVQRYIRYLEISYQALSLPAWFNNSLKKLVKSPKIHLLDTGILRSILGKESELSGNEFESAIVAEIYKQVKTYNLPLKCYYLRTQDGREVDILLESENFFIPIEIKTTQHVDKSDAKHLFDLQEILTKPIKHAFVLSNDVSIKHFSDKITAMPAAMFLT